MPYFTFILQRYFCIICNISKKYNISVILSLHMNLGITILIFFNTVITDMTRFSKIFMNPLWKSANNSYYLTSVTL